MSDPHQANRRVSGNERSEARGYQPGCGTLPAGAAAKRAWGAIVLAGWLSVGGHGCDRPAQAPASRPAATQVATAPASGPETFTPPAFPASLTDKSFPRETVDFYLHALSRRDESALQSVLAYRAAARSLAKLLEKHVNVTAGSLERGLLAETAARSWQHKFSVFGSEGLLIVNEAVTANSAEVLVYGLRGREDQEGRTGQPLKMIVQLVREDQRWRVRPELEIETLDQASYDEARSKATLVPTTRPVTTTQPSDLAAPVKWPTATQPS